MNEQELTSNSAAVVQAYMDTLMTGDIEALRTFFTEESTWTLAGDLPLSGTWTGPTAILEEFVPHDGGAPGTGDDGVHLRRADR